MPAIPFRVFRGLPALLLMIGAAGLQAQPTRADTLVLHFAFDRSDIRPADSQALYSTSQLRSTADVADIDSILITGYTDTAGSIPYNDRLSLRRALAAAALVRQWLGPSSSASLRVVARGESDPIPGDDSASRRVTIICWRHPAPPPVAANPETVRTEPEPDTVFSLDDIHFVANTAILTDAARLALPRHLTDLLSLRDRYLEVDGYCNSPGPPLPPTDPLYILSVQRAKFIYDCLIEKGFDPGRLVYKGKGNTNPRMAHPTTRGESDQNMRVEIKVYKKKPEP